MVLTEIRYRVMWMIAFYGDSDSCSFAWHAFFDTFDAAMRHPCLV